MKKYDLLAITIAPLLFTAAALAQQAAASRSESTVEEVVVTAQRRAENLQDVPVAVSAFTEAELSRRQVTRTIDLIPFVPNMEGHNNTGLGTANTYSIRALNNSESIATFDPPVGTYVDDVFIARQNANNFGFFDVERIEVLRGPQGTLFGRNTTGGAISVVMKKPGPEFKAFAEIGHGEYNRNMIRTSVDLPLSDKFLTKFSAYYTADDGYVKNQTTGETLNGEENRGARIAVRTLFSDAVTWDASVEYLDDNYSNLVNYVQPGSSQRINFTRLSKYRGLGPSLVSPGLANIPLGDDARSSAFISNVAVKLSDQGMLNFITGVRYLHQQFMTESVDSITAAVFAPGNQYQIVSEKPGTATPLVNDGRHTQYTQEIKLTNQVFGGRLSYVTGLFYFHDDNTTSFANINLPVTGPATVTQDRTMVNRTNSGAIYFQGDYKVTDRLTLTAGLRYTHDKKTIDFQPNASPLPRLNPQFPAFTNADLIAAGIPTELTTQLTTPRFAADFKIADDVLLFASATRGFKAGGWNARANAGRLALPFGPEKVWSYEAGMRSEWFDHKLRVNLNAFLMNVQDFQLPAGYFDPVLNIINYITRNFAGLQNYGLESEITWAPSAHWNVFWSAGTQQAKYQDVDPSVLAQAASCQSLLAAGKSTLNVCNAGIVTPTGAIGDPVRAPKFTSTLGVNTTIPVGADMRLVPSVNWSYTTSSWASTSNFPVGQQAAHSTFNGGITLNGPGDRWSIAADCTNCTNATYVVSYLVYPYLPEPSRWMLHGRWNF